MYWYNGSEQSKKKGLSQRVPFEKYRRKVKQNENIWGGDRERES